MDKVFCERGHANCIDHPIMQGDINDPEVQWRITDEQDQEARAKIKKWRDSLAAHAMAALVGNVAAMTAFGAAIAMKDITVEEVVAKSAYEFADALIAEGER
jgi:hypothetical protein